MEKGRFEVFGSAREVDQKINLFCKVALDKYKPGEKELSEDDKLYFVLDLGYELDSLGDGENSESLRFQEFLMKYYHWSNNGLKSNIENYLNEDYIEEDERFKQKSLEFLGSHNPKIREDLARLGFHLNILSHDRDPLVLSKVVLKNYKTKEIFDFVKRAYGRKEDINFDSYSWYYSKNEYKPVVEAFIEKGLFLKNIATNRVFGVELAVAALEKARKLNSFNEKDYLDIFYEWDGILESLGTFNEGLPDNMVLVDLVMFGKVLHKFENHKLKHIRDFVGKVVGNIDYELFSKDFEEESQEESIEDIKARLENKNSLYYLSEKRNIEKMLNTGEKENYNFLVNKFILSGHFFEDFTSSCLDYLSEESSKENYRLFGQTLLEKLFYQGYVIDGIILIDKFVSKMNIEDKEDSKYIADLLNSLSLKDYLKMPYEDIEYINKSLSEKYASEAERNFKYFTFKKILLKMVVMLESYEKYGPDCELNNYRSVNDGISQAKRLRNK